MLLGKSFSHFFLEVGGGILQIFVEARDWGLDSLCGGDYNEGSPHSLGTPIEWKRKETLKSER